MKFNAQQYFTAATERMNQARILYNRDNSYALAMYVAGVAVECMFRSLKLLRTDDFDERHDLKRLFSNSHMLEYNKKLEAGCRGSERTSAQNIQAWMNDVCIRWANDYRYASEDRLNSELKARELYRNVRGDVLKANTRLLLNAAEKLIERGAMIWKDLRKKSNDC
jgi:HEPN domain-containing protein